MAITTDGNPVIYKTNDLSLFKRVKGNRTLNKAHVKKLVEAISVDAESIKYNPILVNEFHEVIDGQHRLEAAKVLQLPMYFIKIHSLALPNAQNLNMICKPWSPMDYAKSYEEMGNRHYTEYIGLKHEFGINHDILIKYISLDSPMTSEMFRMGKLKVKDASKTVDLCKKLLSITPYYKRCKNRPFALAFKTMWEHVNYNHERFIMKLDQKPNILQDRAYPQDYLRDFEALFNHGLEEKKKVRFF